MTSTTSPPPTAQGDLIARHKITDVAILMVATGPAAEIVEADAMVAVAMVAVAMVAADAVDRSMDKATVTVENLITTKTVHRQNLEKVTVDVQKVVIPTVAIPIVAAMMAAEIIVVMMEMKEVVTTEVEIAEIMTAPTTGVVMVDTAKVETKAAPLDVATKVGIKAVINVINAVVEVHIQREAARKISPANEVHWASVLNSFSNYYYCCIL
jgi:hypothetical protein